LAGKCVECVDIANITCEAIHLILELYESATCKIGIMEAIHVKLALYVADLRWQLELAVGVP
jgi:hypothetical protein